MSDTPTSTPPIASIGEDLASAGTAAATIATGVATSNPVGITIGSIEAFNALSAIINNIIAMQNGAPVTNTQMQKLFSILNEQTVSADLAWQKATRSAPVQ